jgi:ornithine cyclodeaminase
MRFFSAQEVQAALPFPALINTLETAFKTGAHVPLRHHHHVNEGTLLLMPAFTPAFIGTKIVSVFPNVTPAVQGVYLLCHGQTGEPLAMIEGKSLTARRTAAVSALASRYLSNPKSQTLLMVGAGALAQHLIEAHQSVRNFQQILLYNSSEARAKQLQTQLPALKLITSLEEGVRQADVISCATLSHTPLIQGEWLKNGAHLDLVGGFTPTMREADDVCLTRSRLYVDSYEGAFKEAGDIMEPLARGVIKQADILGELATLIHRPPQENKGNTLFKAVGTGLADLAAAIMVYRAYTPLSGKPYGQ